MYILLVNDDGIFTPGIRALADALIAAGHRICVCAPHVERSAASHAISTRGLLEAKKVDFDGADIAYAATGTPADCARLCLFLIPGVDMVVSGINNGSNLGGACRYSGTVAAATEASMSGWPALAVSQCGYNRHQYEASGKLAAKVVDWMQAHPLPRGAIYNLNVPKGTYEEIRGLKAAVSMPNYLDSPNFDIVETEEGIRYRYRHGIDSPIPEDPNYDEVLTDAGWATLTKLTWDLRLNASDPDLSDFSM